MKQWNGFRLLLASVCSLLLLAVMTIPALAAGRTIDVFPDEAAEGGKVNVRGSGYGSDYPDVALRAGFPFVTVYMATEEVEVGGQIDVDVKTYVVADESSKVDEFGKFAAAFLVPGELADGEYVADVEEGTYFIYVTYWNDTTIVASSVLEVTEVAEEFPFWWSPCSPWSWSPYSGCGPYHYYYYYGPPWDCMPYPFPWGPPDDCCDWPDDGCCPWPPDEWPCDWNEEDWPYPWPPRPYCWTVIPVPPCDC
ncbi:MAG: hypothetical protein JXA58_08435 [Dehalococcoidia bacterium]|nr:hypothetical protein [Dehalococcoidia bacterium]